jgi:hypothetical protein
MKLIIAGSRNLSVAEDFIVDCMVNFNITPTEIVCGMAPGIDESGEAYAEKYQITRRDFPANWNAFQKAAGPMRNKEMAVYADALLLIWDGESKGSANMKMQMEKLKKPIYEVVFRGPKKA